MYDKWSSHRPPNRSGFLPAIRLRQQFITHQTSESVGCSPAAAELRNKNDASSRWWSDDSSVVERRTRDRKVSRASPGRSGWGIFFSRVNFLCKLQALVYDILPSTTAVFSYAIGPRKVSVNEQFFVGAQTVVSLLQTTQIKQGMSFIAANKVYTSINKTTIV